MREAGAAAAVHELGAVPVRARQLHAGRAHAWEREPHALVDAVHRLQECAEVTTSRADHCVVAGKRIKYFTTCIDFRPTDHARITGYIYRLKFKFNFDNN